MKKKNKIEISVLITNFNNQKFLKDSIHSLKKHKFKNFEIIVIDDQSKDGSLKLLKQIKNIKLIKTKTKTKFPSYNQMRAYFKGYKKSKGKIICFLDSDDFFEKKKLEFIHDYFKKNKEVQIVFDKPIIFFNKNRKFKMKINSRSKYLIPWPQFPPQSCISIRRKYLDKLFKKIMFLKFPNTWLDFRIICQTIIDFQKIHVINEYLTFYRQHPNSQIIDYKKKFSINWWKKREEAHQFQNLLYKKNRKSLNYSIDRFFTKIINIFID